MTSDVSSTVEGSHLFIDAGVMGAARDASNDTSASESQ